MSHPMSHPSGVLTLLGGVFHTVPCKEGVLF